jgi:hypothetical protein
MAKLRPITMPVVLRIGGTEAEIGEIEVPLTIRRGAAVPLPDGSVELPVVADLDGEELRRRIAGFLRGVAAVIERAPADGE